MTNTTTSYSMMLTPSSRVVGNGRVIIESDRTYYGQTERLLSGEICRHGLEMEDDLRDSLGIPSIFA